MSIASYSDLKTAIKNWLNNSDIDSYIPDFITLAEKRLNREFRINAMETAFSDTIASGVVSVPSAFMEWKNVYISDSSIVPLTVTTAEQLYKKYPTRSSDGEPTHIARDASNFVFGPYPDSNYTVKGTYYARLSALSSTSTNWFTTNAPDALLYASLVEAEPFIMDDERIVLWEGKYQQAKAAIKLEDKRGNVRGSVNRSVSR